jgi:NADPH:quinone reductase-like Zn-dependent oxidoreductase
VPRIIAYFNNGSIQKYLFARQKEKNIMILITGASGQVGCAVIRALSKAGIETKAFIHKTSDTEKVKEAGATEVFVGDMTEEKI